MHPNYTFLFFAWILLFSNCSLAYRIYLHPHEDSEEVHSAARPMHTRTEGDLTWSEYIPAQAYQMPDQRARRGWGGGRRRRASNFNQ